MFTGETLAAEMVVRSHNGQLQLHELLLPYPTPVVYFKSSELLLLGPHGIFRRLGSENRNLK